MPVEAHGTVESVCSLIRRNTPVEDLDRFHMEKSFIKRYEIAKSANTQFNFSQLVERIPGKSFERAVEVKNEGNSAFKASQWEAAVHLYNKSLQLMPGGSHLTDLATLFGNRSAALFNMKDYGRAVLDIERAEIHFPKDTMFRILHRKTKALMELQDFDGAYVCALRAQQETLTNERLTETQKKPLLDELTALIKSSRRNTVESPKSAPETEIPRVRLVFSDAVKIEFNKLEGRHCVAKTRIKPGSLILKEEPYAAVLSHPFRESHCQNCFHRVDLAPVFCESCVDVKFCSDSCKEKATFHRFECGFASALNKSKHPMAVCLALRVVSVKDIAYYINLKDTQSKDEPNEADYTELMTLLTHEAEFSANKLYEFTLISQFLAQILVSSGYFKDFEDEESYIGSLLMHSILVLQFNAHEIFELEKFRGDVGGKTQAIGGGIYPRLALFNHSCAPNTSRYYDGKQVLIASTKPIRPGDHISENYGPTFTQDPKKERQSVLKDKYKFECGCQACVESWQTLKEMQQDEKVHVKCQKCLRVLPIKPQTPEIACSCGSPVSVKKALEVLMETEDLRIEAGTSLENGKPLESLEKYVDAISRMDAVLDLPDLNYSLCQKSIRNCFSHLGNCVVHEKPSVAASEMNYFM